MKKTIWIGCTLLIASGVAIGIVPGVRSWIHDQVPFLGINGSRTTHNTDESRSAGPAAFANNADRERSTSSRSSSAEDIDQTQAADNATMQRLVTLEPPQSEQEQPTVELSSSIPDSQVTDLLNSADQGPIIRLAQATLPAQDPSGRTRVPSRIAQGPIGGVPNTGLPVPSAAPQGSDRILVPVASLSFVPGRDIKIAASSDGIITQLHVDEGVWVKEGDVLFELDSRIALAEVTVQTKELEQSKLKAEDDSNIRYANAAAEVARKDYENSNELLLKGAEDLSTNEKKGLEKKKAELQIKVSTIEHAKDQAAVGVNEAKLSASQVQVELRKFKAPWVGVVNDMEKGQFTYVRAGEVLFRLTDMSKMRVSGRAKVTVPPHLLFNAPAKVSITVAPGVTKQVNGVVGYVSPRTDSDLDTYSVWVEIDNEKITADQYLLRAGMAATIEIFPNR